MPVLRKQAPAMPKHINPTLRVGEVYRIIRSGDAVAGGIFVCGSKEIVYLTLGGGFDDIEYAKSGKLEFVTCTLQEV